MLACCVGFLRNAVFGFICGFFFMSLVEAKSPTPSSGVNVDVLCMKSVSCPVLSIKMSQQCGTERLEQ